MSSTTKTKAIERLFSSVHHTGVGVFPWEMDGDTLHGIDSSA